MSSDGTTVPVKPGSLRGMVQLFPGSLLGFSGWAAEPALTHRADSIAVVADGKEVFASPTDQLLPHRIFPHKGLFGFHFELPRACSPAPASTTRCASSQSGTARRRSCPPGAWEWGKRAVAGG